MDAAGWHRSPAKRSRAPAPAHARHAAGRTASSRGDLTLLAAAARRGIRRGLPAPSPQCASSTRLQLAVGARTVDGTTAYARHGWSPAAETRVILRNRPPDEDTDGIPPQYLPSLEPASGATPGVSCSVGRPSRGDGVSDSTWQVRGRSGDRRGRSCHLRHRADR